MRTNVAWIMLWELSADLSELAHELFSLGTQASAKDHTQLQSNSPQIFTKPWDGDKRVQAAVPRNFLMLTEMVNILWSILIHTLRQTWTPWSKFHESVNFPWYYALPSYKLMTDLLRLNNLISCPWEKRPNKSTSFFHWAQDFLSTDDLTKIIIWPGWQTGDDISCRQR